MSTPRMPFCAKSRNCASELPETSGVRFPDRNHPQETPLGSGTRTPETSKNAPPRDGKRIAPGTSRKGDGGRGTARGQVALIPVLRPTALQTASISPGDVSPGFFPQSRPPVIPCFGLRLHSGHFASAASPTKRSVASSKSPARRPPTEEGGISRYTQTRRAVEVRRRWRALPSFR